MKYCKQGPNRPDHCKADNIAKEDCHHLLVHRWHLFPLAARRGDGNSHVTVMINLWW